jgi:hypothetical protein
VFFKFKMYKVKKVKYCIIESPVVSEVSIFDIQVDLPRPFSVVLRAHLGSQEAENYQGFLFPGIKHWISNGYIFVFRQVSEFTYRRSFFSPQETNMLRFVYLKIN